MRFATGRAWLVRGRHRHRVHVRRGRVFSHRPEVEDSHPTVSEDRVLVRPVNSSSARAGSRGLAAVVCFGVLAGIGLRVFAYVSSLGTLDGDEAVWGLMARHFRQGELSAFFW